jgi:hypothetical protein
MVRIQLVGGPTAILEVGGSRLVTDPTFDSPGSYPRPDGPTLVKLAPPAVTAGELGPVTRFCCRMTSTPTTWTRRAGPS